MLSLKDRVARLESDLKAVPSRISIYRDMPFAIFVYEPREEWRLRHEVRLLASRLSDAGKRVHVISMADLLWECIEASEGLKAVVDLERRRGFKAAQDQVTTYLSDRDFRPLPDALSEKLRSLDPSRDIAFLLRVSAMAPAIYNVSRLLSEMQGRTMVTTILFYPGTFDSGRGLKFMGLESRDPVGNYRVNVY